MSELDRIARALARFFRGEVIEGTPGPLRWRDYRRSRRRPGDCWCGEPGVSVTASGEHRCHFHAEPDDLAP